MRPYYQDDLVTLYHADWRDVFALRAFADAALVSDVPYGIRYVSGYRRRSGNARSIEGDHDTTERDACLAAWGAGRALVFGSWKVAKPGATRMTLYWDTGGALGMGDLSLPWRNSSQEIYVLGRGFLGRRRGNVVYCPPVQSLARLHPHQKPVDLMMTLVQACPDPIIVDPFCGSGPTLRAAKNLGRRAIGVEIVEKYCERAAERCRQETLALGGAA